MIIFADECSNNSSRANVVWARRSGGSESVWFFGRSVVSHVFKVVREGTLLRERSCYAVTMDINRNFSKAR